MIDFSNVNTQGDNKPVEIFNNGKAGKAENVKVKIEKNGVDYTNEGSARPKPDYSVVFTDENGYTTNTGFYYLNESEHNSIYSTFEESRQKQYTKLAHILTALGVKPETSFDNEKEMLDKLANQIKQNQSNGEINVFANYGHVNSPRTFIQIRSWLPFAEPADAEKTMLKETAIDQMERLVPDTPKTEDNSSDDGGWV